MSNALSVKNLVFKSGKTEILHNISFDVPTGSIAALIGDNGAGKTTTIKCITNLYPKYQGEVSICESSNKDIKTFSKIGYVPEKENFPKIKLLEFLTSCAQVSGLDKSTYEPKIKELISQFKLDNFQNKYLNTLSSGEKKKVLVAQALIHDPDLIIADEPTENLSPTARLDFYEVIKKLHSQGKTILICTHQLDEIQKVANYVVFINYGTVKYNGKISKSTDLYALYKKYE
jgi:ABC-2 type transport system ATP-binding protein